MKNLGWVGWRRMKKHLNEVSWIRCLNLVEVRDQRVEEKMELIPLPIEADQWKEGLAG